MRTFPPHLFKLIAGIALALTFQLRADGFIIIEPPYPYPPMPRPLPQPSFTPFPLEVRNHHVQVTIEDLAAATSIDQVFYNPTANSLQGYYLFPIPRGVTITKFSMYIDGKETEAELLDAEKARKLYEDYVRKVIDPALLEYTGQGVLKVRIFPIQPHSEKRIKLSYSEVLSRDNGTVEYIYPLNTEKFSAAPLKEVSVKVEIHSREPIKNVYCPTHEAEIRRTDEHRAMVGYEANNVKPDADFKVYYRTDASAIGFSLLSYRKGKEDGFFFLSLTPGFASGGQEVAEKDITFVLDVSGSMAGKKLQQAKRALQFCIENLNPGDRFEIVRFSTQAEALFQKLAPADAANRAKAGEFVENLKAIGGTNIDEALQLALQSNSPAGGRPGFIIFITDGKPTVGEVEENALLKKIEQANRANLRIFTFGIGDEINTHLLDKITEATNAYRTYITPDEDIEVKISDFYGKVSAPILTDLKLSVENSLRVSEMYPARLPDLFKGATLTVLGRYREGGEARITLKGKLNDEIQTFEYRADFAPSDEQYVFIPPLWASRAIGYMLDQIRLHGESEDLKKEIIELARTYGIITPYTSYLILEDEEQRVSRRELPPQYQLLRQNLLDGGEQDFLKSREGDYADMKSKSGRGSVAGSQAAQSMGGAANIDQTRPGASRLSYRDRSGREQNLASQFRMIQGRAVYQSGDFWVDSEIQNNVGAKVSRIQFASEDYFRLLNEEPQSGQFLALGRNLRFFWKDRIYEVYE